MAVGTLTTPGDLLGDLNNILVDRVPKDMDDTIKLLEDDDSQFVQMYLNLDQRPAKSQKVEWLEDELLPRVTQIAGALTNVGATITVAANTAGYFRKGDIARIAETGENVLVTGIPSASTITVVRGIGSVAGTAITITTGDLIRLGNAAVEGDTLGPIVMTKQSAKYNYTQIFRNALAFTNTVVASDLYGGREPAYEARKKLLEHRGMIENQSFFGRRNLDLAGTNNLTSALVTQGAATEHTRAVMGGLDEFITTNVTNSTGAAITAKTFETFLRKGFRYGSRNKVLFCSPLIASALSSFPMGALAPPDVNIKTWGVSLSTYRSAQGQSVKIAVKPDWADFQITASDPQAGLGGLAYLVDMDNVRWRPLRSTKLLPNRQQPSEDSNIQEYLTEGTLQVIHERTHAKLVGVPSY
jgi:hypothetical protein